MDLEAIVALNCVLGDVHAGAQVNLTVQLIRLQQEDSWWSMGYSDPP